MEIHGNSTDVEWNIRNDSPALQITTYVCISTISIMRLFLLESGPLVFFFGN